MRIGIGAIAGVGDLHDPSCAWYCGICPWSVCSDCVGPCSCSSNQIWDSTSNSCLSQQVVAPNLVSGTVIAGEPTTSVCTASTPGSTVAGTDANGNLIYLCQSTAAQDQAALVAAMKVAAQPATPTPVDCTSIVNQLTSVQCSVGFETYLAIGVGIIALVTVLGMVVRR